MPSDDYTAKPLDVQVRLLDLDLTPERLMLVGAIVVAYDMFETTLERAFSALHKIEVDGVRPFTEKLTSEQ